MNNQLAVAIVIFSSNLTHLGLLLVVNSVNILSSMSSFKNKAFEHPLVTTPLLRLGRICNICVGLFCHSTFISSSRWQILRWVQVLLNGGIYLDDLRPTRIQRSTISMQPHASSQWVLAFLWAAVWQKSNNFVT